MSETNLQLHFSLGLVNPHLFCSDISGLAGFHLGCSSYMEKRDKLTSRSRPWVKERSLAGEHSSSLLLEVHARGHQGTLFLECVEGSDKALGFYLWQLINELVATPSCLFCRESQS